MKRPITVHAGNLVWVGEHWLAAIRPDGATAPSAWVSLFHTRYSSAGEGNVAQVMIPGSKPFSAICSDSPELAEFFRSTFLPGSTIQDPAAPTIEARFRREGDIRRDPSWMIEAASRRILARWRNSQPPVIADGTFREGTEHFSVLYFTDEASVELDGQAVQGKPYPRDTWKASIGGERSSCFIALAETFIELPGPQGTS